MSLFKAKPHAARIALNKRLKRGPWGGANQWLAQVVGHFERCGYEVRFDLKRPVDAILFTHSGLDGELAFSAEEVAAFKKRHPSCRCIHRINDNDIRKGTTAMDRKLADTDALIADHTVFVSEWLRGYHAERWFDAARRPGSVILNGSDPSIFHPIGSREWNGTEPMRILTHHWSPNWNKGFRVYKQIDDLIADGKAPGFELWVIGRWPAEIQWRSARTFPPTSGHDLAALLRQGHLYVSASLYEPGGNHPAEGIQCGLPILFHESSGGTPEQTRHCGLVFNESTLAEAMLRARSGYAPLRAAAMAQSFDGDAMCGRYRLLAQHLITTARASRG